MPGQTRTQATSTTAPTTSTTTTGPQSGSGDNTFLAALLTGVERLDDQASVYFARGIRFQRGMRGELIKRVQKAIGTKDDGIFGPNTENLLKQFQKVNGLPETGVVDEDTWSAVAAKTANLANLQGEEDFARMWNAHPHNYQDDPSMNTPSEKLVEDLGMREGSVPNTCALRMSTMLNRMGGDLALSTGKARQAGLQNMRAGGLYMPRVDDKETEAQTDRVILSAKEMWTYVQTHRGAPDVTWPPRGRFKTEEEAEEAAEQIKQEVIGKKGLIAFDKIFGYGGTGHVDLFDGQTLSDGSFYPSQRTMIWFVVP